MPKVKIYTLSTCSHCWSAKRLLKRYDVNFDAVDVDMTAGDERQALIAEVKRYNPACSFPTLVIGDKVIVGYREDEIKEALGL
jgi:glutaredoxin